MIFPLKRFLVGGGLVLAPLAALPLGLLLLTPEEVTAPSGDRVPELLAELHRAQIAFRAEARVDLDGDGVGEAGFLSELAGTRSLRGVRGSWPALLGWDSQAPRGSSVVHLGYRFRLALPALGGGFTQGPERAADPDQSEVSYFVHAWPNERAPGETRVYVQDGEGHIWVHADGSGLWRGAAGAPPLNAGLSTGASTTSAADRGPHGAKTIGPAARVDAQGRRWSYVSSLNPGDFGPPN